LERKHEMGNFVEKSCVTLAEFQVMVPSFSPGPVHSRSNWVASICVPDNVTEQRGSSLAKVTRENMNNSSILYMEYAIRNLAE